MPDTTYPYGTNILVYQATNFTTGVTVTAKMWDPDLVEVTGSPFALTEIGNGLYKFEYIFDQFGIYHMVFLEGGTEKLYHTSRIPERTHLQAESKQKRMNLV